MHLNRYIFFVSLKGPQKYLKGLLEDDEEEKPEPYILESKINFETDAKEYLPNLLER